MENNSKKTKPKLYKQYLLSDTGDRVTGLMLSEIKTTNGFSVSKMAELFGTSFNAMQEYLRIGDEGIDSKVVCYLYRLYRAYPELMQDRVSIREFFSDIGGSETIRKTDFSLIIGLEQSAYSRFIDGDENPSSSILKLIDFTKRISGGDSMVAFGIIQELCAKEGLSRGFNVLDKRTWNPDPTSRGKPRRVKKDVGGESVQLEKETKPATKAKTRKKADDKN